jgi:excisionase family DNA binding protein
MNEIPAERWVSTKEISLHLGVNKDTVHKWIRNQNIPCHRIGKLWKFKISEVDEWVKNGMASNID